MTEPCTREDYKTYLISHNESQLSYKLSKLHETESIHNMLAKMIIKVDPEGLLDDEFQALMH